MRVEIEHIKEFIKRLKKFASTHDCEIEGYKCNCHDKRVPDQNCWVIPKEALYLANYLDSNAHGRYGKEFQDILQQLLLVRRGGL